MIELNTEHNYIIEYTVFGNNSIYNSNYTVKTKAQFLGAEKSEKKYTHCHTCGREYKNTLMYNFYLENLEKVVSFCERHKPKILEDLGKIEIGNVNNALEEFFEILGE